ncbi:hypothetical protein [Vibrio sp. MACH09]|uniref:hypothetical protein n=1 Tax=Vibrio sp. MACH09 TaxID=3025122 RepID=UPI00295EE5AF|nr:hypothetical protein [Vibrio sp. MACH09]
MMLVIVTVSVASSGLRMLRSNGVVIMPLIGSAYSHSENHNHFLEDGKKNQQDASNHTHDNVTLDEAVSIALLGLTETENSRRTSGFPIRKPFKIKRPPRGHHSSRIHTATSYVGG